MPQHELQYLQEMGIQCYELSHPERLQGYQAPKFSLQASCKLLLVSPEYPKNRTAELLERVLKSMHLTLSDTYHLYPEQISQLEPTDLEWVWFAGCEQVDGVASKALTSPLLSGIDGNNEQRRALWQQICSHQS